MFAGILFFVVGSFFFFRGRFLMFFGCFLGCVVVVVGWLVTFMNPSLCVRSPFFGRGVGSYPLHCNCACAFHIVTFCGFGLPLSA